MLFYFMIENHFKSTTFAPEVTVFDAYNSCGQSFGLNAVKV